MKQGKEMTIIEETIGDSKLTTFAHNQEVTELDDINKKTPDSHPYNNFTSSKRKNGSMALQNYDSKIFPTKAVDHH